jgi:transcriptional regulator with XRE-family HTH domain
MLRIAEDPRVSNMKEVGLRIRALREKYNLPQEVFARKVLISRSNLSELENGKRAPTGPLLVALECLFSANKEWVLTGKGDMTGRLAGDNRKDGVVELVDGFRRLSGDGRKKILNLLRVFLMIEETGGTGGTGGTGR